MFNLNHDYMNENISFLLGMISEGLLPGHQQCEETSLICPKQYQFRQRGASFLNVFEILYQLVSFILVIALSCFV